VTINRARAGCGLGFGPLLPRLSRWLPSRLLLRTRSSLCSNNLHGLAWPTRRSGGSQGMRRAHEPPARFPQVVGAGGLAAANVRAVVTPAMTLCSVTPAARRKCRRKARATASCPRNRRPARKLRDQFGPNSAAASNYAKEPSGCAVAGKMLTDAFDRRLRS
jgi:hypothetical protein